MTNTKKEPLFMDATEVAAKCKVCKTTAYSIIKGLNEELKDMNKLVQNGKVQRLFFYTRFYGNIEENRQRKNLFLTVEQIAESSGIPKNTLYPKIREANKWLQENGYITIAGRLPASYYEHKWLYERNTKDNLSGKSY